MKTEIFKTFMNAVVTVVNALVAWRAAHTCTYTQEQVLKHDESKALPVGIALLCSQFREIKFNL